MARPDRIGTVGLWVGAALLLGLVARCYALGSVPLWTDELFTVSYPRMGWAYLWTDGLRTEPTPPLYYSLIGLVQRWFGDGAAAMRAPSVAGSLAAIGIAAALARELSRRHYTAPIAAAILALAPLPLFLAQEARAYALQGAALALALLGFAWCLRGRQVGLLLYGVGAAFAMWLHPTSALALVAFNLAALASLLGRTRLLDGRRFLHWCAVNAVVGLLCLPLAPLYLSNSGGVATRWIDPIDRWTVQNTLGQTLAGPALTGSAVMFARVAIVGLVLMLLLPRWRPGRRAATVLVLVPGLFVALMIGVSVIQPILLDRTLAWVWVPLAVVLGDVLARWPRPLALAGVAAVAAGGLFQVVHADSLKENWPRFLARLPGLSPDTLVVLAPHTSPAVFARYAPQAGTPVRLADDGPAVPETTVIPALFHTETITPAAFGAAVRSGRPVWLVYRRPEYAWMQAATAGLPPPADAVQDVPGRNPALRALRW